MEIFLLTSYRSLHRKQETVGTISIDKVADLEGKTCDLVVSKLESSHDLPPVFIAPRPEPLSRTSKRKQFVLASVFQSTRLSVNMQGHITQETPDQGHYMTNLRYLRAFGKYVVTVQNGDTVSIFHRRNLNRPLHTSEHKLRRLSEPNIEAIGAWVAGSSGRVLFVDTLRRVVQIALGKGFGTRIVYENAEDVQIYGNNNVLVLKKDGIVTDLRERMSIVVPRPKGDIQNFNFLKILGQAGIVISTATSNPQNYQARFSNYVTLIDLSEATTRNTLNLSHQMSPIRNVNMFVWKNVGYAMLTSKSNQITVCAFSRQKIFVLMNDKVPAGLDGKVAYPAESIAGCCHLDENRLFLTTDKSRLCLAELYWPGVLSVSTSNT